MPRIEELPVQWLEYGVPGIVAAALIAVVSIYVRRDASRDQVQQSLAQQVIDVVERNATALQSLVSVLDGTKEDQKVVVRLLSKISETTKLSSQELENLNQQHQRDDSPFAVRPVLEKLAELQKDLEKVADKLSSVELFLRGLKPDSFQ